MRPSKVPNRESTRRANPWAPAFLVAWTSVAFACSSNTQTDAGRDVTTPTDAPAEISTDSNTPIDGPPTFDVQDAALPASDAPAMPVECTAAGTFCGSHNVTNGSPSTLYQCPGTGMAPTAQTLCAMGCTQHIGGAADACAGPGTAMAAPGGAVLDGWGGIHPFGSFGLDTTGAAYWMGWDIARSLVVLPDGSGGWTLDGWGGTHPFGHAPALTGTPYWMGWDIARALVVLPDHQSGYVLDGYGGVHSFGPHAPALTGAPYWSGFDIARGLEIHTDASGVPDGGWVLDGWGGLHPFGAAHAPPALPYYPNYDLWQRLHASGGGLYAVGRWGFVQPLGSPDGVPLAGMADWGNWDIVRDVVVVNARPGTPFDTSREITCPSGGDYCGTDAIRGRTDILYHCTGGSIAPASVMVCPYGCSIRAAGTPDVCNPPPPPPSGVSCSYIQWWNRGYSWSPGTYVLTWTSRAGVTYHWDSDLAVAGSTPVQLRHDSRLLYQAVYPWGWMPEWQDMVTGEHFAMLHLRPQHQLTTSMGTVYPAGTLVGYSGGDTTDTGYYVSDGHGSYYSTGAHLCIESTDPFRTAFPMGTDACH